MKKIFMKIHEYEESSKSFIVSFASTETKSQNPDDYSKYAYQPLDMFPGIYDINEIKKRIAVAGIYETERQARHENLSIDQNYIDACKSAVGSVNEYLIEELTTQNNNASA